MPVAADVTVGDLPVRHTGLTPAGIEGLQGNLQVSWFG